GEGPEYCRLEAGRLPPGRYRGSQKGLPDPIPVAHEAGGGLGEDRGGVFVRARAQPGRVCAPERAWNLPGMMAPQRIPRFARGVLGKPPLSEPAGWTLADSLDLMP